MTSSRRRHPSPVSASAQRIYERGQAPAPAGPDAAQGAGQPGQRRLGLPRHRRGAHPHQLPRRQPGGAAAGALSPGLQHRRSPRGAAAAARLRRHPRSRHRQAGRPGAARRPRRAALPSARPAARAGRAHLLARQPARRRLRRHRGHLQRAGRAQLLPDDLLCRLAQPRRQRRPDARRPGRSHRRQRRRPARRRAGQLPGPGRRSPRICCSSARGAAPITGPAYPALVKQLWTHQAALTSRFLAQPWRQAGHARYVIPLPQETFMRCWGRSTPADTKGLEFEHAECEMDTRVFVSRLLTTGSLNVRHEAYDGAQAGHAALRPALLRQLRQRALRRGRRSRPAPRRSATSATSIARGCRCAR